MTYVFTSILFLFLLVNCVSTRNYSITFTGSKLPTPRGFMPAVYDGNNTIYLVGGQDWDSYTGELLKYNITAGTFDIISTNVVPTQQGSAPLEVIDQSIYYSGGLGYDGESGIWKVLLNDPETLVTVDDLPNNCSRTSSIWNQREYIYIVGGMTHPAGTILDTVVRFSKISNTTDVISRTPDPVAGASAVWDPRNMVAYIFGGYGGGGGSTILMFNETTGIVTRLDAALPYVLRHSCEVLSGREAFVVGGWGSPSDEFAFIKFDTITHEVTPLLIENFRVPGDEFGCTWVKSVNRIYLFGGSHNGGYQDATMYIDMNEN